MSRHDDRCKRCEAFHNDLDYCPKCGLKLRPEGKPHHVRDTCELMQRSVGTRLREAHLYHTWWLDDSNPK